MENVCIYWVCVLFTICEMGLGFLFLIICLQLLLRSWGVSYTLIVSPHLIVLLLFLGASWESGKQHSWRWSAGYYTDVFFQWPAVFLCLFLVLSKRSHSQEDRSLQDRRFHSRHVTRTVTDVNTILQSGVINDFNMSVVLRKGISYLIS